MTVEGLRCRYGSLVAVDDVSFAVSPGEHAAVMGANGSGKSTVLRSIAGLTPADSGAVTIGSVEVSNRPAEALRRCAWVPQRQSVGRFPLLVGELLDSSGHPAAARRIASDLDLSHLFRRPLTTLSGGQLQRAFLARAMGSVEAGASVLLADEPTAALDFDGQAEIASLLRSLEVTILVVTHDRAVADTCDRRFEMAAGQLREIA